MWYAAVTVGSDPAEPVAIATAKAHLRVDHDDDNAMIERLIASARSHVEKRTGTKLVSRAIDVKCDGFGHLAAMADGPISGITSVKYIDTDGVEQTLATTVYELRTNGIAAAIVLKYNQSWPAAQMGSQITVRATCGYSTIPPDITHAMLSIIGHWYENREALGDAASELPMMIDDILCNHRLWL